MVLYIIIQLSRHIVGLEGSRPALSVMNVPCSIFGPFLLLLLAYHVCGGVVKMDLTPNDSKWQIYLEAKTHNCWAGDLLYYFPHVQLRIRRCKLVTW